MAQILGFDFLAPYFLALKCVVNFHYKVLYVVLYSVARRQSRFSSSPAPATQNFNKLFRLQTVYT